MKRSDLTVLLSVAVLALIAALWLLVISPKRHQAADLKDEVDQLHASVQQAQDTVALAEQARKHFETDYRQLVVLGKAVPEDGDQASLLVQLQRLAERSGVQFRTIDLSESSGESTSPPTTPPSTGSSTSSSSSTASSSGAPPAEPISTVAATEAVAATLPIGASIGPAGLPVMPYDLKFSGGFFQIADFLQSLDRLVHLRHQAISVDGRLLTVNGFGLSPQLSASGAGATDTVPTLDVSLAVTTYLTPADQGITAGATAGGPAPATPASATPTPASSTSSASSTTATSNPTAPVP